MLRIFSWFVFLIFSIVCQTASIYDLDGDNEYYETNRQRKSLTPKEFGHLDEYFARKLDEESFDENINPSIRYQHDNYLMKRDALWTTTEVLDCIRRLKYSQNISKLDLMTEMLNCYRRLRHMN